MNTSATITDSSRTKSSVYVRYAFGMDISNWDRLDGRPEKMTRDEFVRAGAQSWESVERYLNQMAVEKCECGSDDCPGWRDRYMFRNERRRKGLLKFA